MKIDFAKISKISTKEDLKKYPINEPYFLENYLFHYLILTDNLKALKLQKFPVNRYNEEGLNGFHLAAKYNNYKILKYLIETYPSYIYDKTQNDADENFLHYLEVSDEYVEFILNTKNVKWNKLFTHSSTDTSPLHILFGVGTFDMISKIITKIKFDYSNYSDSPFIFSLAINNDIKEKELIEILKLVYKQDKNIFDYVDSTGNTILLPLVLANKYNTIKYLSDKNINFDKYTPLNTLHAFTAAYNKGINYNDYKIALFIIKKIIKNHNFNETDKNGDNFVHFILKQRIKNKKGSDEIEDIILSHYNCWDKYNVNDITPLDLISQLDYDKYHKYIGKVTIDIDYKYKDNIDSRWKKLIDSLEKTNKDTIKMIENKYSHGNQFQAKFSDIVIFAEILDNKYKNLYLPKYEKKNHKERSNITMPDNFLYKYNNFPWLVVWNNKDNYFIHSKLVKLMNDNKDKYDYGCCFLSLRLPDGGLHATLLLFDFNRKVIERFDPYGNTIDIDVDMDVTLMNELTRGNDFTYYCPNKYFPVAGFQTLTNETSIYNQKMGDFGGYCLAWCLWYIEHRILNMDIDPKTLIRKTINKFMKMEMKPIDYIRNYANNINEQRLEYLRKLDIPEDEISNEVMKPEYNKKMYMTFIKNHNGD